MAFWSPDMRNDWIDYCMDTDEEYGCFSGYAFERVTKFEDNEDNEEQDTCEQFVTHSLASALYEGPLLFKELSLGVYKACLLAIGRNAFLTLMKNRGNFLITLTGNNAYRMALKSNVGFSNLEISFLINPNLSSDVFQQIHESLVVMVSQVMSKYKQELDLALFKNEGKRTPEMDAFIQSYKSQLKRKQDCKVLSPFESKEVRNFCSNKSYITIDRKDHDLHIEVPHFPECEFIPLRRTPFVLSYDNPIPYARDQEGKYMASYDHFSLKLNNVCVYTSTDAVEPEAVWEDVGHDEDGIATYTLEFYTPMPELDFSSCFEREIVQSKFIDVYLPCQDDSRLCALWTNGLAACRYRYVYERCVDYALKLPTIQECIRDLEHTLQTNTKMTLSNKDKLYNILRLLRKC